MKTKPVIRKFFIISMFVASMLVTLNNAYANGRDTTPVDFKYIGVLDNQPLFQLNIANPGGDVYTIKVFDEEGYIFYYYTTRSQNFSKIFQLQADDLPKGVLNVEIRSKKNNTIESFRVSRNSRLVQETSVSKS
jgi:hypothetical protein